MIRLIKQGMPYKEVGMSAGYQYKTVLRIAKEEGLFNPPAKSDTSKCRIERKLLDQWDALHRKYGRKQA